MDIETVRQTLQQADMASLGIGFALGFVFTFNPVVLASIPVSLAYVTRARERKEAIFYGGMFILGMLVTQAALGAIAGFGGQWVQQLVGRQWGVVLGPLLIVLGLIWAGWLKLPLPALGVRGRRVTSGWGAFALGAPFSVALCPICTPALVVLLGLVAGVGSPVFGVLLLLAFALGRAVPIIMGAVAVGWLEGLSGLQQYHRVFATIGGILLILSGLYMLNAYYFVIPRLAG